MSSFAGYPKGLSYAFGRMQGFSKSTRKVSPDKTSAVRSGSTIKVKIDPNSLFGLRTLSMYYKFTTSAVGLTAADGFNQGRYAPRLSSSIIESIQVYMNGYQVDNVNNYNLLYNTLFDLSAGNDQTAKRIGENLDPSVKYTEALAVGGSTITKVNTCPTTAAVEKSDINRSFVINNFCNFLGNSSCEYLDTNDTGDFEIRITLAPATICWRGGLAANAVAAPVASTYQLDDIFFTYSRIVFEDTLYEQIKSSELISEKGLQIKWTAWENNIGSLTTDRNINYNININASSLDKIIATTRRTDFDTETYLQLTGGATGQIDTNFQMAQASGAPDLFNQSIYFRRDLSGLTSSQFFINGTQMSMTPLTPLEVYNETLIALNEHSDLSNGVHAGQNSLHSFLKYYFAHILSLEYCEECPIPTMSGLDGKGSSFNIIWRTSAVTVTSPVYPVLLCACSRVLTIHGGRQISVQI